MASTPFDKHSARANEVGYHNHRVNTHSDLISENLARDLYRTCAALRMDLDEGRVGWWLNSRNPWGRNRNTDLLVAQPEQVLPGTRPKKLGHLGAASLGLKPNRKAVRIVGEHKSIVTAHRNRSARHDDLDHLYQDANAKSPKTVVVATIMIGTAPWYLNVADGVKDSFARWERDEKGRRKRKVIDEGRFKTDVLPRLRRHDDSLMDDFIAAVSQNTPRDIEASFALFCQNLPTRRTHDRTAPGFDALLVVPVNYDNIHPAKVDRANAIAKKFKLNPDKDYSRFLRSICDAYTSEYSS